MNRASIFLQNRKGLFLFAKGYYVSLGITVLFIIQNLIKIH